MTNAVVLHSGGLDSSTLLYRLVNHGLEVVALSVNYGQRHERELTAARQIAEELGVEWRLINLAPLVGFLSNSALTNQDIPVPHGLYDEENMSVTVVPNRNMILYSIAAGYAQSIGANVVAGAQHAGDHAVYPDCRPDFLASCNRTVRLATDYSVKLYFPFVHEDKTFIARQADKFGVPIERTWSCYEGGEVHCGRCGTCVERIEAIHNAGLTDPTEYAPGGYEYAIDLLTQAGKINDGR